MALIVAARRNEDYGTCTALGSSSGKRTQPRTQDFEFYKPGMAFDFAVPNNRRRRAGGSRRLASVTVALAEGLQRAPAAAPPAIALPREPKVDTKPATDVLAGALARAASQGTIHPLDTLKVRLQTGKGLTPRRAGGTSVPGIGNTLHAVRKMYRGVLGAASGAGFAVGAYFLVYGVASNALANMTDMPNGLRAFVAGGIAAAGSSVVKVPIAVCIRSVQAGIYPNAIQAARSIMASAGPRGLFTGYVPTLVEDVPDMAVKFAVYETLQTSYRRMFNRNPGGQEDFLMGAFAGAVAAAATTPFDVVKTNMMCCAASRPGLRASFRKVAAQGPGALFSGVGPRALSSGINSAIFFCFFEMLRTSFVDMRRGGAGGARGSRAAAAPALPAPEPVLA